MMPPVSGGGASYLPQFSHDGQRVLFLSYANNLVTNDDRGFWLDAFVRDLGSSTTYLISAGVNGNSGANENVTSAALSPDGQWVVFPSAANNLLLEDPNGTNGALSRRITAALTTILITNLSTSAVARLPNCSLPSSIPLFGNPVFSADGRFLVFESYATNLVAHDTNNLSDIFLLNLTNSQISLVSAGAFGQPCPGTPRGSHSAAVNADGSRVAFVCPAILPAATVHNALGDVYVRDLTAETTYWASRDVYLLLGQTNGVASFHPALSAEGRQVVFLANYGGSSNANLIHHDLDTATSTAVSSNTPATSYPTVSTNGHIVTYIEGDQIYQWNPTNSAKTLISIDRDGFAAAGGRSHSPAVTPDGKFIAFLSDATDLVPGNFSRKFRIYRRDTATGTTELVTPLDQSADEANQPVISNDGRRIAFESKEPLVAGDSNQAQDIFVFDAVTGVIELVSRAADGWNSETGPTHVFVNRSAMSTDGRFVAYESMDIDQVPGDTNRLRDGFVYDRVLRTNIFLGGRSSSSPIGGPAQQLETLIPRLSSNGRYVAFAERTFSGTDSSSMSILRRDLLTGEILDVASNVTSRADYPLSLSADGSRILFGTTNSQSVVKDLPTNSIYTITNSGTSRLPSLSRDGRWVFEAGDRRIFDLELGLTFSVGDYSAASFSADSRTLILHGNGVAQLALQTRTTQPLWTQSENVQRANVSANGMVVAFEVRPSFSSSLSYIVVIDLQAGTTNYLSPQTGSASSAHPLITYDGRYVAFLSNATNLAPNDTEGTVDLFVHDLTTGQVMPITFDSGVRGPLTQHASAPTLGGDGRSILFMSLAQDVIAKDFNGLRDVFILKLGSDDSDQDGLDDDWEWAYFSTLARDGSGDFDSDGSRDVSEFRAGTDPTNEGSVFRVLTVSRVGTDEVRLIWQSVPGKSYRLQYQDMAGDAGWVDTAGIVIAQGFSASKRELRFSANRFYRVALRE